MNWSIFKKILFMVTLVWGVISLALAGFIFLMLSHARNETRVIPKDTPTLLNIVNASIDDKQVAIVNVCEGKTQVMNNNLRGSNARTCVGTSQLKVYAYPLSWDFLTDDSGTVIHEEEYSATDDGRMLFGVEYGNNGKLFLEFVTAKELFAFDSVMEGQVFPHMITAEYDTNQKTFRFVSNFPKAGRLLWNRAGNEAIIVPGTCYIDCSPVTLGRYSVDKDTVVFTTKEDAYENMDAVFQTYDREGSARTTRPQGAYWDHIWWNDKDIAMATLKKPDGATVDVSLYSAAK